MATVDEPLRAFSRVVLGWQDESHPFAIVMCAAMLGDMLWAPLAMLIGTGRLRAAAPILARAFRLAALQAATAPLFTLAYFLVRGGDGLNVWSGLLGVLVGSIDAGGQVPSSVRVVGTSIFFLLPAVMVAWRLGADRRALGAREDAASAPVPGVRGASGALSPRRRWTMPVAAALVVPLLGIWSLHVSAGPWSWVGQSVWLALWLGFLAACHRGVLGLTPEGRRLSHAAEPGLGWAAEYARLLAGAWPLAVAGVVVQVGLQWLVTAPGAGVRFFGWFLGQVDQPRGDGPLLPAAMAVAFLANALWTWMLLALAKLGWHERLVRAARTLELGALQAATTPLALVAFMVLSIITRDRAAPGIPRYDVWHAWTYVARAAVGASFATETVPAWLSLVAAGFLIGLPLAAARACFIVERRALRRWLGSEDLDGDAAQVARRPGWTSLIRRPGRSRPALVGRRAAGA